MVFTCNFYFTHLLLARLQSLWLTLIELWNVIFGYAQQDHSKKRTVRLSECERNVQRCLKITYDNFRAKLRLFRPKSRRAPDLIRYFFVKLCVDFNLLHNERHKDVKSLLCGQFLCLCCAKSFLLSAENCRINGRQKKIKRGNDQHTQ